MKEFICFKIIDLKKSVKVRENNFPTYDEISNFKSEKLIHICSLKYY